MTRFVILAVPRTGSNLLCTLLNSHPRILCHHEVFNPQGIFTARDLPDCQLREASLSQRDADPLGFLDRVWKTGSDVAAIGFKWTRDQDETVLRQVVADRHVRKIVLRRRNRIKTFVSESVARQTQQWEVYSRRELVLPRPRIHVEPRELLEHIAVNQRFYDRLQEELEGGGQPHLQVEYESLFADRVQQQLLDFLGVSAAGSLVPASVKQNPTCLRDMVVNFDELTESLLSQQLVAELHDCGI
jgi:LPS sulfotransferase NodH